MSNSNIPSPTSYLDFSGLSDLRHRAAKDGEGALRETAKQFEALFIQMMMKSMRDATFKSDLLQSDTQDTYQEMFDKELSVKLAARGGFGMTELLSQQLSAAQTYKKPGESVGPAVGIPLVKEVKPMAIPAHWTSKATSPTDNGDGS